MSADLMPCYCHGDDLVVYCPRHTPLPGETADETAGGPPFDSIRLLLDAYYATDVAAVPQQPLKLALAADAIETWLHNEAAAAFAARGVSA